MNWFKSLLSRVEPAEQETVLRAFAPDEPTIRKDGVSVQGSVVVLESHQPQTFRLYEFADPGIEQCLVTFRAEISSELVEGRAFLEMWCRIPGRGEFFSKGLDQAVAGSSAFSVYEVKFHLKKGQAPDLIKLNVVVEGRGQVCLKKIELLSAPLR